VKSEQNVARIQARNPGVDVAKWLGRNNRAAVGGVGKYNVSAREMRTLDGIVYDSKLEMLAEKLLREHGIAHERQAPFILQEGFTRDGKKIRDIRIVVDFVIALPDGRRLALDAKGLVLREFKLKAKLLLARHGVAVIVFKSAPELREILVNNGLIKRKK
jgi:hypothetical protein